MDVNLNVQNRQLNLFRMAVFVLNEESTNGFMDSLYSLCFVELSQLSLNIHSNLSIDDSISDVSYQVDIHLFSR
ncbi:hypothetical protein ACSFXN_01060 [Planococcus sp. 1R117A]|uniref:hypothetical protein n=1 Tax=Planococcus sp. 1R117A TaxID=3447020 RepID=UPI003EDB7D9B